MSQTVVDSVASSDGRLVLAAVCLASLVLPLDFSGAAAATPAIGRSFLGGATLLAYVVNAFMLTFGSTLLTAGALADAYGRKRVFTIGVAGFVATSLAICLAPDLVTLDVLRAVQGVAAAATLAGGSAALAQEFEGEARTRAFGLLGTTFGTGLALGPTIAGLLIEASGWRAIFLVGAVVGGLSLVIAVPRMRETRAPDASGPDWLGAIVFTAVLALLTAGLLGVAGHGWSGAPSALIASAALALVLFVLVERRVARPMLDLALFRYPRFVGVQLLPVATCASYVVLLVLLPARFIGLEGQREVDAGLLMLALSAPMIVVPVGTAVLTRWFGAGILSGFGLIVAAAGLVWLATVPAGGGADHLIGPLLVIGIGTAMPWGLMDGLSVSVVPTQRAGMATGIFSTVRVAGEGIALAIVRAILAARLAGHLDGHPTSVAAWIAAGDLPRAMLAAPTLGRDVLLAAYSRSFAELLIMLAVVVAIASLVVVLMLREGEPTQG